MKIQLRTYQHVAKEPKSSACSTFPSCLYLSLSEDKTSLGIVTHFYTNRQCFVELLPTFTVLKAQGLVLIINLDEKTRAIHNSCYFLLTMCLLQFLHHHLQMYHLQDVFSALADHIPSVGQAETHVILMQISFGRSSCDLSRPEEELWRIRTSSIFRGPPRITEPRIMVREQVAD